eukprot:TRINITY_DN14513_c0_g1_i1.p2 TRINITY_DN14513_c0_g1~~TRINITY_DN14513_c0_g1_i1.p2  ORF type:complete len:139 (+),score=48.51 TRINITY_DN14513_c0_g1_i1:29-418(+)
MCIRDRNNKIKLIVTTVNAFLKLGKKVENKVKQLPHHNRVQSYGGKNLKQSSNLGFGCPFISVTNKGLASPSTNQLFKSIRLSKDSCFNFLNQKKIVERNELNCRFCCCLLYTSPSPRDLSTSRMPSSA